MRGYGHFKLYNVRCLTRASRVKLVSSCALHQSNCLLRLPRSIRLLGKKQKQLDLINSKRRIKDGG